MGRASGGHRCGSGGSFPGAVRAKALVVVADAVGMVGALGVCSVVSGALVGGTGQQNVPPGPRQQGPLAGNTDTHLSRDVRAMAPMIADAVGGWSQEWEGCSRFLGLSRCSQVQGSNDHRC